MRVRRGCLLATGCGYWGWRRLDQPTPGSVQEWADTAGIVRQVTPQTEIKVWSGGKVEQWHSVVFSRGSVSGIPHNKSLDCYSCVPNHSLDRSGLHEGRLPHCAQPLPTELLFLTLT